MSKEEPTLQEYRDMTLLQWLKSEPLMCWFLALPVILLILILVTLIIITTN